MAGRLEGKVAIITGAARGQGAAEARRFVEEGATVVVADILEDEGREVVASLGDAARWARLDVTDEADWAETLALCEAELGAPSILVNNAGVVEYSRIVDTTLDQWNRVLAINLTGTFLGMKAVAPAMERADGGSIVNISSTAGLVGLAGVPAYGASKWAVRGLTKNAALELGPSGIRVNSVHPGGVDTPMTNPDAVDEDMFDGWTKRLPLRRIGRSGDVADLVLFLASDESSYCTGGEFAVDGGATAGNPGF